jgi:hypothetical protein
MVAWTSYLATHMGDEGVHTHLSQNGLDEDRLQPSGGPLHHGEEVGEPSADVGRGPTISKHVGESPLWDSDGLDINCWLCTSLSPCMVPTILASSSKV